MKIKNTFAIGCIVQWYEIEIIEEYLESVKNAIDIVENKENVIVDLYFNCSQELEKVDEEQISISEIKHKYEDILERLFGGLEYSKYNINSYINEVSNSMYTIADYRREFNDKYCDKVDVLMWGETDSILPKQTFQVLDNLHTQVKNVTPKYVSFFGICKMWDDSWKILEHPDFTDKPFIEGDTKNWWSLRYTMNKDEMNKINNKTEDLEVLIAPQHKFNGCGLVISSEVIKSGVNIPKSVFFVHEDTAFMLMTQKVLGNIPQYIIKNILLVHNRNHPDKRMYIKANKMSEQNCYNIFNPNYKSFTWEDVWK